MTLVNEEILEAAVKVVVEGVVADSVIERDVIIAGRPAIWHECVGRLEVSYYQSEWRCKWAWDELSWS